MWSKTLGPIGTLTAPTKNDGRSNLVIVVSMNSSDKFSNIESKMDTYFCPFLNMGTRWRVDFFIIHPINIFSLNFNLI